MAEMCQVYLVRGNEYTVRWAKLKDALSGKGDGWPVVEAYTHFIGVEYVDREKKAQMRIEYRR